MPYLGEILKSWGHKVRPSGECIAFIILESWGSNDINAALVRQQQRFHLTLHTNTRDNSKLF